MNKIKGEWVIHAQEKGKGVNTIIKLATLGEIS
jgi:hypothetical protein